MRRSVSTHIQWAALRWTLAWLMSVAALDAAAGEAPPHVLEDAVSVPDTTLGWDGRWSAAAHLAAWHVEQVRRTGSGVPERHRTALIAWARERLLAARAGDGGAVAEGAIAPQLAPLDPDAFVPIVLDLMEHHPGRVDGLFADRFLVWAGADGWRVVLERWVDEALARGPGDLELGNGGSLVSLARLGGVAELGRLERLAGGNWPARVRHHAVEAITRVPTDEARAVLLRLYAAGPDARMAGVLGDALIAHDRVEGVVLLAKVSEPADGGWRTLESAAIRKFADRAAVMAWARASDDMSLHLRRAEALVAEGYEVGRLETVAGLSELLRAAGDPRPSVRAEAWTMWVELTAFDPSDGGYWTVQEGPGVTRTWIPPDGDPSEPEWRPSQAAFRAEADAWLTRHRDRLEFDAGTRRFVIRP